MADAAHDSLMKIAEQERNKLNLVASKPTWGYLLSKKSWMKYEQLFQYYLDMFIKDYRARPHTRIYNWLAGLGYPVKYSSQDAVNSVLMNKAGLLKLTTWTRNATYIGAEGQHFTTEEYLAGYYGKDKVMTYSTEELNNLTFNLPENQELLTMIKEVKERLEL